MLTVKKGFTLMEMLIVVAIIGILAAVSIPVFSSSLDSVRSATCAANRRSLKAVVAATYMTDGSAAAAAIGSDTERMKEFTCPSKGKITYEIDADSGAIFVYCTEHQPIGSFGKTLSSIVANLLADKDFVKGFSRRIDSTSPDGPNKQLVLKAFSDGGIDVDTYGVQTWAVTKDKYTSSNSNSINYVWSTYAIDSSAANKALPVIGYNPAGYSYNGSSGKYVVGLSNIAKSDDGDYSIIAKYNVPAGEFKPGGDSAKVFESYEEAKAYYNTLSPTK